MNEQTINLLEKLSSKLGVATQVLWSALIKQAPISGTIDIIVSFFFIIISVLGAMFLLKKTRKEIENNDENDFLYSWGVPLWIVWGIYTILVLIIAGCTLSNSISGIVNPEYWALKEILSAVK